MSKIIIEYFKTERGVKNKENQIMTYWFVFQYVKNLILVKIDGR